MDEVKIQTNFMKTLLSKLIGKLISNKIGTRCDLNIKQIHVENNGEKTKLILELDVEVETSSLLPILKQFKLV